MFERRTVCVKLGALNVGLWGRLNFVRHRPTYHDAFGAADEGQVGVAPLDGSAHRVSHLTAGIGALRPSPAQLEAAPTRLYISGHFRPRPYDRDVAGRG